MFHNHNDSRWGRNFPWLFACLLLLETTLLGQAQDQNLPPSGASIYAGSISIPLAAQTEVSPYTAVARGANHRILNRVTATTNFNGRVFYHTNTITELATGMHHLVGNQWVDSTTEITLSQDATSANATHTSHQLSFTSDVNTIGATRLTTPDGKLLSSRVLGLSYLDPETGNSVLIAELTNSVGQLLPNSQVLYPGALTGDCTADILYKNTLAGSEQFIILKTQTPSPEEYNLSGSQILLQVMTEFFNPPTPIITTNYVRYAPNGPAMLDETLDFGAMKIGAGKAFLIGDATNTAHSIRVLKQWVVLQGRTFLLEQVPLSGVVSQLQTLPPPPAPGGNTPNGAMHRQASPNLVLPVLQSSKPAKATMRLAQANDAPRQGYMLDYSILASQAGFTFQADSTYYITNLVNLSGTTTLEGGAVIKYSTNGVSQISVDTLNCQTAPYEPAIFTARDDDTVGEAIADSSHTPSGYYALIALDIAHNGDTALQNVRIAYAHTGLHYSGGSSGTYYDSVSDVQILHCSTAIDVESDSATRWLRFGNGLIDDVSTAFNTFYSGASINHLTADRCRYLGNDDGYGGVGFAITNSILANVTNLMLQGLVIEGRNNGFYNSQNNPGCAGTCTTAGFQSAQYVLGTTPFQTVVAGSYYLADGSSLRNLGTTNIGTNLLAEIRQKTTYPPIVFPGPGTIHTNSLNLFPQAQRDTDTPDLGYHYDPLDYVFGPYYITNATVTLNPGTAISAYSTNTSTYGLTIGNGAKLLSLGTVANPNWIVEYNSVQEQFSTTWNTPELGMVVGELLHYLPPAIINCRFTHWSGPGGNPSLLFIKYGNSDPVNLQDCQFHGGNIGTEFSMFLNLTNCLFERTGVGGSFMYVRNNLFYYCNFGFDPYSITNAVLKDNLFDHTAIEDFSYDYETYNGGYNAYVTNCDRVQPTNATDITLSSSPAYQVGPLGNYYYPAGHQLINAGSIAANLVGLYHYTTLTNQTKETTSAVDVGYHYVAVASGVAIDTDGDGLADYFEDTNGNGTYDSTLDLSNWGSADTDGDSVSDFLEFLEGRNPKVSGTTTDTTGVIALKVYTPLK